ncbi:MAG TPA: LuxR C-terminal-related transcriptional regulator, partial [Actinophytocola sp.]|nr:LuxR C-terminal-related transcriptional regulator [Actinophytocola sp.]
GPVSVEYATRHPERLSRLVFYGTYAGALGNATPEEIEMDNAFQALIKVGWERPTPEFRRVFTSLMIPEATEEQMRWLDELQRMATTADTAMIARAQRKKADVRHLLPELDLPTLVIHSRGDRMNGFEEARYLAANIPGARLVALESKNHIVLEDELAWPVLLAEVTAFLAEDRVAEPSRSTTPDPSSLLSARELDVLTLAAEGCDNDAIAARLTLSVRTVERHLQNVYAKLGLQGRSARTAAVAALLSRA